MFHKIKSIKPSTNYCIIVVFENDETKTYNVSKLFDKYPSYRALETIHGLFKQVKVDKGGYGYIHFLNFPYCKIFIFTI